MQDPKDRHCGQAHTRCRLHAEVSVQVRKNPWLAATEQRVYALEIDLVSGERQGQGAGGSDQ